MHDITIQPPDPQTGRYHRLLSRMLYDSPLHRLEGRIVFLAILLVTLYLSLNTWVNWLTPLTNGYLLLFGVQLAFHKRYLKGKGRPIEGDSLAQYWRTEVVRLRNKQDR